MANEISDFDSGIHKACKLRDQSSKKKKKKKKSPMHTYILYWYFVHNNKYTIVLPWIFVTGPNFVSPLCVTCTFGQRHPLTNSTYRPTDINVFWIPHCRCISQFKPTNLQLTNNTSSILRKQRMASSVDVFRKFFWIKNTWCTTEINWEYFITKKKRAYVTVQYCNKFGLNFLTYIIR